MRRLILLALVALAAFPLSAHGRWRGPRRVVVYGDSCRGSYHRWEGRTWSDDRWERRDRMRHRRHGCEEDRVFLGPLYPPPPPLPPPFQGRVELWIR